MNHLLNHTNSFSKAILKFDFSEIQAIKIIQLALLEVKDEHA